MEDVVNINGVEYSKGSGNVVTLYCWRNTDFGIYYYTSTENPSVGDIVYYYAYIDGSGNPVTSSLQRDLAVSEVGTDSIIVPYTHDKVHEAAFNRYFSGDIQIE